jgi:hypothetical protein
LRGDPVSRHRQLAVVSHSEDKIDGVAGGKRCRQVYVIDVEASDFGRLNNQLGSPMYHDRRVCGCGAERERRTNNDQ